MPDLACEFNGAHRAFQAPPGITHHPKVPAQFGERTDDRVEDSDEAGDLILPTAKRNAEVGVLFVRARARPYDVETRQPTSWR
jgi:hypothetical protein